MNGFNLVKQFQMIKEPPPLPSLPPPQKKGKEKKKILTFEVFLSGKYY